MNTDEDPRRDLPQVEALAAQLQVDFRGPINRPATLAAARTVLGRVRSSKEVPSFDELLAEGLELLRVWEPPHEVVNATGVLMHTNLGRAPAAPIPGDTPWATNIELDLYTGKRGGRLTHIEAALTMLTGAERALALNNNAGATLAAVSALASGGEVLVSRGELVEIGGGFRIPEIITQGGATLREVGTTNRTTIDDYREAVGPQTRLILWVHRSNYTIEGFTESVRVDELARLAKEVGVPLVCDIGSGLLDRRCYWLAAGLPPWLKEEPGAFQTLEQGANLITFSGDKLLGGPQAGLVCGDKALVDKISKHPLSRALRYDRIRATHLFDALERYLEGMGHPLPLWQIAEVPTQELWERAENLVAAIPDQLMPTPVEAESMVGAGAAPGQGIPGVAIALHPPESADTFACKLRTGAPPIVGQIRDGVILLHIRTFPNSFDLQIASRLHEIVFD